MTKFELARTAGRWRPRSRTYVGLAILFVTDCSTNAKDSRRLTPKLIPLRDPARSQQERDLRHEVGQGPAVFELTAYSEQDAVSRTHYSVCDSTMRKKVTSCSKSIANAPHPLWLLLVEDENGKLQDGNLSADQQDQPRMHHDALEFPDGTIVLLTDLREGQEATVLQLPARPKTPAEEAAQRPVTYVG